MRIWARELSPLVAVTRRALPDQLARDGTPPERIAGMVAAWIGPRRVLRDRVMSPAWDVAVPTFDERPGFYEPALRPQAPIEPVTTAKVELARAAAEAAELDDLWFARAQWMVRRALLAHGAALQLRRDDVFWLPLDELLTLRSLDPDDAHRRAAAARAARARAAEWDMPLLVHGNDVPHELPAQPREVLRGVGFGPRLVGRVVRFAPLTADAFVRRGYVVVTPAITPALAMVVHECAALVSETGGLLDHGAALARELGITCVVGCAGAWAQLPDGAAISVSGDAGLVELAPST